MNKKIIHFVIIIIIALPMFVAKCFADKGFYINAKNNSPNPVYFEFGDPNGCLILNLTSTLYSFVEAGQTKQFYTEVYFDDSSCALNVTYSNDIAMKAVGSYKLQLNVPTIGSDSCSMTNYSSAPNGLSMNIASEDNSQVDCTQTFQ